jgi:cycloeucalenol cycloisomerase
VYPLLWPGADSELPWTRRYTTKANAWIFVMAWQANYFWTHYFYQVLGCEYTFPAWRLNNVPFCLYLMSHSYFLLYHSMSNRVLRRLWAALPAEQEWRVRNMVVVGVFLAVFSYVVAMGEVFTIQNFPYYKYKDAFAMFVYGSVFYGLYFITSFPMFLRLDEEEDTCWSLSRTVLDSFACCMIITTLLDFWRLSLGPIFEGAVVATIPLLG